MLNAVWIGLCAFQIWHIQGNVFFTFSDLGEFLMDNNNLDIIYYIILYIKIDTSKAKIRLKIDNIVIYFSQLNDVVGIDQSEDSLVSSSRKHKFCTANSIMLTLTTRCSSYNINCYRIKKRRATVADCLEETHCTREGRWNISSITDLFYFITPFGVPLPIYETDQHTFFQACMLLTLYVILMHLFDNTS